MARRRSRGSKAGQSAASRPQSSGKSRRSGGLKRWLIALVVVAVAVVGLCHKGLMAEAVEKLPMTSAEGVVSQLLVDAATGHKVVQASLVIDAPADRVWDVVTDYAHFSEIFPMMSNSSVERTSDGRRRLSATVSLSPTPISWTFSVKINHEKSDRVRIAEWDDPSGRITVNRGFMRVEDLGEGKTRVVHRIDTCVRPFPSFVLRAAMLASSDEMLDAVRARVVAVAPK